MSNWSGASAIVTGAASGIGFAPSEALVKRDAKIWMTDVDHAGVEEAATALRGVALNLQIRAAMVHSYICMVQSRRETKAP